MRNRNLLTRQITEFKPSFIYCRDRIPQIADVKYELLSLENIACHPQVDIVVIATSGKSGLRPTLAAVKAGKTIALANKESLVMAGEIITGEAKTNNAKVLPIDSEHSAIWQCLNGEITPADRLILTASGGSFRCYSPAQLKKKK